MDPSRKHIIIHVINNCEGPRIKYNLLGEYNTNSTFLFLYFYISFIKFSIGLNTRAKQELSEVDPGTSGLLGFGCPTKPYTPYYSIIYDNT